MDKQTYEHLKSQCKTLTSKNAEDDLTSFFAYVNSVLLMDIKDRMKTIIEKI